jgi:drug/metabolite transporter (DMT)-like permease
MQDWVIFILASNSAYAAVTLLDRQIMGRLLLSPIAYLLIGNWAGLAAAGVIWQFSVTEFSFQLLPVLKALTVGGLFSVFSYLYFRALEFASPVATVSYMQIVPVLTAVATVYLQREDITQTGLISILILSVGLSFVSLLDRQHTSRVATLMIPGAFYLAISYILQKDVLDDYSIPVLLALNRIGALITGFLILLVSARHIPNQRASSTTSVNLGAAAAVIGELVSIGALFFLLKAYSAGPFAEVSAIASTLPILVMLGAVIIRVIFRTEFWVIPEIRTFSNLLISLVGFGLITLAIYLASTVQVTTGAS